MFEVTKSYGAERGFTTSLRNWRDSGHCSLMHGYALRFDFTFAGPLDARGWLVDFGALKPLETWLRENHDHVHYAAEDDPQLPMLKLIEREGLIRLIVLPCVSMEHFAERAANKARYFLNKYVVDAYEFRAATGCTPDDLQLKRVEVWEHPSNKVAYNVA